MNIKKIAQNVFENEGNALLKLSKQISRDFEMAVDVVFNSSGKLIISGMGKSGLIGKKIAATLSSTGTSSFFLHPGEAYHGDLGMIQKQDIVLLMSYSGETDEVLKLIPFLKQENITIISMTGNNNSTLAKNSDFHLYIGVENEVCPHQLAPTTSTTAALVMGDALAVSLMQLKAFQPEDFAKFHPGGSLGRKLLTTVGDLMITKNLPTVNPSTSFVDILTSISSGKIGASIVLDNNVVVGIITDGDLRRAINDNREKSFTLTALDIMSTPPLFVKPNIKIVEAENVMISHQVTSLIVISDDQHLLGVLSLY